MLSNDIKKTAAALSSLLLSWWRHDRVRISPREGLLLRLRPPCLIMIADERVQIEARRVLHECATAMVVYDCLTENGPARLCVESLSQGQEIRVRWGRTITSSGEWQYQELSADDIAVYALDPTDQPAGYDAVSRY